LSNVIFVDAVYFMILCTVWHFKLPLVCEGIKFSTARVKQEVCTVDVLMDFIAFFVM
jgi:hypothetical protein